jgi:hypothetical protein
VEPFGERSTDTACRAGDHHMTSDELHVVIVGTPPSETERSRYDAHIRSRPEVTVGYDTAAAASRMPHQGEETSMTETHEDVIHEALSVIDKALGQMMSRELVSTGEVTDVLLDVRSLLTLPVPVPATSPA